MDHKEIYELVESGLERIEEELSRQSRSKIGLIDRISRYIQTSGGKRIRPTLLLLTSQMCGYEGPISYRLGAVVEMIHAATLLHDDVIDESEMRRGRASVNATWGNETTVLMGDWLFLTSFTLALGEKQFKILEILSDAARNMIEGELLQLSLNGSLDVTEEQHLEIAMRKTAFLFSACSQLGGLLGAASDEKQEQLCRYGLNLGMAFQMVDDVLDLTSTQTVLGKPVLSDLRQGRLTLPLIYLVRDGTPEHREIVRAAIGEDGLGTTYKEMVLNLVHEHKTAERVLEKARRYAELARNSLAGFPACRAREALLAIPDHVIARER